MDASPPDREHFLDRDKAYNQLFLVKSRNSINVLDLFCGCGGLSLGFKRAGFNILAGIDNDRDSLKTFNNNFNGRGYDFDLSSDQWLSDFIKAAEGKTTDIIIGGPPCQGFSLTGSRVFDDPRNILYSAIFKAMDRLSPKVVLIENVKGMAGLFKGRAKERVREEFWSRGYSCIAEILNSAKFGVPQIRERLFFIAVKNDITMTMPSPLFDNKDYLTCGDAISDLPSLENELGTETADYHTNPNHFFQELMQGTATKLYNHVGTRHKDFVIETIRQVKEGKNHKDLPPGVGTSRTFNEAWTRYHSKKPSRTIDTGHRNHFHYKWNRVPTVRENARLQTFPDDFQFLGTKTQQYRQVGNAVPVFLAQVIAEHIYKSCFGSAG